jgi:16S rRNA (cytosine967-C5)-methyltransferase
LARVDLPGPERALATEIVYGVLRHKSRIDRALSAMAPRGLKVSAAILVTLRIGAYQILLLDRIPHHAAVDDAVEASRRLGGARIAGFVNGLLRRLGREGEPPLPVGGDALELVSLRYSLPAWIARELLFQVGLAELAAAAAALVEPAPLTARANLMRIPREQLAALLAVERPGARIQTSPLCPEALHLDAFGAPEESRSFQDGLWSVQDSGAQLIARMAKVAPGQRVLDACAGVGGKSTHLAELTGDGAAITAADLSERKLDLLGDAARRLRLRSIRRVASDLRHPGPELEASYDAVLLDAPCTGLGVLRRHPEAKWRLEPTAVGEMAALQGELLAALAPRVAPGGVLIYSVCTFTAAEGPAQVARFLAGHSEFEPTGWARTWPHHHRADAFFAARMRRRTG